MNISRQSISFLFFLLVGRSTYRVFHKFWKGMFLKIYQNQKNSWKFIPSIWHFFFPQNCGPWIRDFLFKKVSIQKLLGHPALHVSCASKSGTSGSKTVLGRSLIFNSSIMINHSSLSNLRWPLEKNLKCFLSSNSSFLKCTQQQYIWNEL